MVVEFSVVVCTRNRARYLEKCLRSLLHQSIAVARYEIIVVDNGSTDKTREIMAGYLENQHVRYIFEEVAGLSRARNRGWQAAQAPYIGYIDDDAVAEYRWVEDALWSFQNHHPEPSWVGGPVTLEWESAKPEWINAELSAPLGSVFWGESPRPLRTDEWFIGANSCFSKKCLELHGGFDERLGRIGTCLLSGEETQLRTKIDAVNGVLFYHPQVAVKHFVPASRVAPRWFYQRYFWGGVTDCYMRKTLTNQVSQCSSLAKNDSLANRWSRLMTHLFLAVGLGFSAKRTIRARIYLSYVVGTIYGYMRWQKEIRS